MPKKHLAKAPTALPIDANPTKELFIEMLTRDIPLPAAILDLVDNSVDGARRLRGSHGFEGLFVEILVSKDQFSIKDNCGGISIETAVKHAFRFGRPKNARVFKHSIGRFGVGMKRAIFKIGREFSIKSTTTAEKFRIEANVDEWAGIPQWGFDFAERKTGLHVPKGKTGTTVTIGTLRKDVELAFDLPTFASELAEEIRMKLGSAIRSGLRISINEHVLKYSPIKLLTSKQLDPAIYRTEFRTGAKTPVLLTLYCGLDDGDDIESAGWHVFCNGRRILGSDQTTLTGWGAKEAGVKIPSFHGQFNLIRGYAFFDCDDASLLPWNTTKTGVNSDLGIYQATRLHMINLMRPVVNFCNRLKEEREALGRTTAKGPLAVLLSKAIAKPLEKIKGRRSFVVPTYSAVKPGPALQWIRYERLLSEVDAAKKILGASTYKEVGELTFEYFFKAEVEK